ncbi:MAG: transcriptional repressor [bacterium]|nr:MAG: transcriptional repressor [bacterium]
MQPVHNIRMTTQRRVILEELRRLCTHPTADELYELVRKRLPHISLGTVYRNLELMSRYGIIRTLRLGGEQMRFDGDTESHHHIRCIRCGRIDDLSIERQITECDREAIEATGYEAVERRVEFLGICPVCKKEAGTDLSG